MAATPVASAVNVAKKHCLLCNEAISTEAYDDVKKEGLNKLRNYLSDGQRWKRYSAVAMLTKNFDMLTHALKVPLLSFLFLF